MTPVPPHLRPVSGAGSAASATTGDGTSEARWDGITQPASRGGNARYLTDVIVGLGLASQERVDAAVAAARAGGTTPEAVLLERGDLDSIALRGRSPSGTGSTTWTSRSTPWTWGRLA